MSYHCRLWIAMGVFFFSLSLLAGCAVGELLTVCEDGCGFSTIKAAMDAAKPGDVIKVQSGIYKENIQINKSLTLIGEDIGTGMPIIDAGGIDNAVTILADGVTVEGFNLTLGSSAGIKVLANNSVLKNNLAFHNDNGISLINSFNSRLEDNDLLANGNGIFIETSHNIALAENKMRDNYYGLFMVSSSSNWLSSNIAEDNNFGIKLDDSENNTLINNQMMRNIYNFGAEGYNNISMGNLIDSRPILYLLRIGNRTIDSSAGAGTVYCLDCQNITIRGLNLSNNFYGIYMDNSTGSLIEQNDLRNGYIGIALHESYDIRVSENKVSDNIEDGIEIADSDYSSVNSNRLENNGRGIFLLRSSYTDINNNLITDVFRKRTGVYLDSSLGTNLTGNSISGNYYGIKIISSIMNNLTENTIINNSINITNSSIGISRTEYENYGSYNLISYHISPFFPGATENRTAPEPASERFESTRVKINSTPDKADIWIDKKPSGLKTPNEVELSQDKHDLDLKLNNMEGRRTIRVREEPLDVLINLIKRWSG